YLRPIVRPVCHVPVPSTIYPDKPMRNHTLMQTIARANRVFPGKHSGLIVDYANVSSSLEKPLREAVEAVTGFCTARSIELASIEAATGLDRLDHIADAVNRLIS